MTINSIAQKELERTSESCGGQPAVAVSGKMAEGVRAVAPTPSPISASSLTTNKGGGGASGYLEYIANVSSWLDSTCEKKGWFVAGECENGHRFAKEIACGKEWCPVCGEKDSAAHLRRFARWLPKAFQIEGMGYFVFTIPPELRAKYRTKKALGELGHQVQELLKGFGYCRGLRRWHWFGDIALSGLRGSPDFHPHLNCLVDGEYIEDDMLDEIKAAYASLLGAEVVDVWYHYYRSAGMKVHKVKYVTRASFLDYNWDIEMALELRNFRNMVSWGRGKWDDEPSWSLSDLKGKAKAEVEGLDIEAINSLGAGVCPVCGEALAWGEALPVGLLAMVDKQPLGAGYYRLADNKSPPPVADDVKQRLYWLELIHRAEVQVAAERASCTRYAEAEYQAAFWWDILN